MAEARNGDEGEAGGESTNGTISFRAVWKKEVYSINFSENETIGALKAHLQSKTGIPPAMMKLMYKGNLKDVSTLKEAKIVPGIKIMVIGSTFTDVMAVSPPDPAELKQSALEETDSVKESLSEQTQHKKILDKGKPDDAYPGIKRSNDPLPPSPISGLCNKYGAKVRLHFKLELEQLWIGTKERTDKVPLGSIRKVISEPIKGQEEYHIMALQLGPTENSRYWLYWVPAQFIEAIKDVILGKWQYF